MVGFDIPQRAKGEPTFILHPEHTPRDNLTIPNVSTLPELFRRQAHRRQDTTLFSFRSPTDTTLTTLSYVEAYEKSSHIAKNLYTFCQDHNDTVPVVGIWLERSIDLHLAILGTTISGAAWLPFDADAPATRVRTCLEDSNACVLPDCIC